MNFKHKFFLVVLTFMSLIVLSAFEKDTEFSKPEVYYSNGVNKEDFTQQKVSDFTLRAQNNIKNIKKEQNNKSEENEIYLYTEIGNDFTVIYEEYENTKKTPKVIVNKNDATYQLNGNNADLPGGYGGRQKISNTSIGTLTTDIYLGASVRGDQEFNYIYTGFSGSNEADAGFQWDPDYNVWKPYMAVTGTSGRKFVSPYNQVQYKNGFKPGATISTTLESDYNNYVRLQQQGYANCGDLNCNNPQDHWMTSIMVTNEPVNVSYINYWKVLATHAGDNYGTTFQGNFVDIEINGSNVPNNAFYPVEEDYAEVYRNNNDITILVDKK